MSRFLIGDLDWNHPSDGFNQDTSQMYYFTPFSQLRIYCENTGRSCAGYDCSLDEAGTKRIAEEFEHTAKPKLIQFLRDEAANCFNTNGEVGEVKLMDAALSSP